MVRLFRRKQDEEPGAGDEDAGLVAEAPESSAAEDAAQPRDQTPDDDAAPVSEANSLGL